MYYACHIPTTWLWQASRATVLLWACGICMPQSHLCMARVTAGLWQACHWPIYIAKGYLWLCILYMVVASLPQLYMAGIYVHAVLYYWQIIQVYGRSIRHRLAARKNIPSSVGLCIPSIVCYDRPACDIYNWKNQPAHTLDRPALG